MATFCTAEFDAQARALADFPNQEAALVEVVLAAQPSEVKAVAKSAGQAEEDLNQSPTPTTLQQSLPDGDSGDWYVVLDNVEKLNAGGARPKSTHNQTLVEKAHLLPGYSSRYFFFHLYFLIPSLFLLFRPHCCSGDDDGHGIYQRRRLAF